MILSAGPGGRSAALHGRAGGAPRRAGAAGCGERGSGAGGGCGVWGGAVGVWGFGFVVWGFFNPFWSLPTLSLYRAAAPPPWSQWAGEDARRPRGERSGGGGVRRAPGSGAWAHTSAACPRSRPLLAFREEGVRKNRGAPQTRPGALRFPLPGRRCPSPPRAGGAELAAGRGSRSSPDPRRPGRVTRALSESPRSGPGGQCGVLEAALGTGG